MTFENCTVLNILDTQLELSATGKIFMNNRQKYSV